MFKYARVSRLDNWFGSFEIVQIIRLEITFRDIKLKQRFSICDQIFLINRFFLFIYNTPIFYIAINIIIERGILFFNDLLIRLNKNATAILIAS